MGYHSTLGVKFPRLCSSLLMERDARCASLGMKDLSGPGSGVNCGTLPGPDRSFVPNDAHLASSSDLYIPGVHLQAHL
ncbi:hypothetical protein WJX73_003168 [Symbiochloris irregularis]|uniref:Uncharacterized protein n=1 Tax=Symbiochloris irregularis TaxID=706552 RepID=A0AAW1NNZ6_9CHLO